ncbi:fimbrial protein [Citrobacter amalonaticus]|uniref:fimbrial protein n=1 Tax=Citrobacter amalonaticus TaxID=35703 RepID=UPI00255AC9C6|nr:fimbrial protein [Citrobacter amalonaticus]MDL4618945.1 fimbrial protein [Citrobacter amalonaticus]MDL4623043.1 fimbrial protein [Citrobacter amalonaticus]
MSLKISLFTGLILAACMTPAHADTPSDGVIHFTGEIIEPSCTIDSTNNTVLLGSYPTSDFTDIGHKTDPVSFIVKLDNCPVQTDGLSAIQLVLGGTPVPGRDDLLAVSQITSPGTTAATNIGIAVSTDAPTPQPVQFNSEDQVWVNLPDPDGVGNPIMQSFLASYQSYAAGVTAGPADADMTITILYR